MSDKKRKGLISESRKMKCSFRETSCIDTSWTALKPHRLKQAIAETFAHTSRKRVARLSGGIVAATLMGVTSPALSQTLELFELDGSNGFKINGEFAHDNLGTVAGAGDVNGDGIHDVIIGARRADPNGISSGASYVVFGSEKEIVTPLELLTLDGNDGFKVNGERPWDYLGMSVSAAGDVNGDGIGDVIIGSPAEGHHGRPSASYVVFGSSQGFSTPFEVSSLNGNNGFKISGKNVAETLLGISVSSAGDFNNDGTDDLIVGAVPGYPYQSFYSSSYIVYGSRDGFTTPFELSSLNGDNGFAIKSESRGDFMGFDLSGAGDVNGDGIADVIIGAHHASPNSENSGASYVIFGSDQGFDNPFNLSDLDGSNGFKINGESASDLFGFRVAGAGDVNGDGIADVIIGAHHASPNGENSGANYVIFGSDQGFDNPFNLSDLDGSNGFKINGESASDFSGSRVAGAGDVNGDGIGDIVISASGAEPNGVSSGASYVLFGQKTGFTTPLQLSTLNGDKGFRINGESLLDFFGGSSGAGDINGDGFDDLIFGAIGADPNGRNSGTGYVVFGSSTIGQRKSTDLLACLEDINGNGSQEVAVLVQDISTGDWRIVVKDVASGDSINEFNLRVSSQTSPISPRALEVVQDTNNNNAPEVAILDARYDKAQVWDLLTGEWLGIMSFPGQTVLDIELVTDQDGNQIPDLAHLGEIRDSQSGQLKQRVLLNDVLTGSFIDSVGFNNNFVAKDLSVIDDANGDLKIAVLGENKDRDEADVVRIKKLSDGTVDNKLYFGKGWQVQQLELLSDLNGNGSPEAAVLRVHSDDDRTNVLIKDTQTGEKVSFLGFDPDFETVKMAIVPPIGDSDAEKVAVLSVRSDGSRQKVWVKDSQTNELMSQVFFNPNFVAKDFTVCPDMNGNGASELAVLGKRGIYSREQVFIKDASTGEEISNIDF